MKNVDEIKKSFLKYDFQDSGPKCFVKSYDEVQITVLLSNCEYEDVPPQIFSDKKLEIVGITKQDLLNVEDNCWNDGIFDYETFLEWLDSACKKTEPGFGGEYEDVRDNLEPIVDYTKLRIPELENDSNRELTIYTWGRALRKRAPEQSQRNFNAAVLNGRRKGVNLKKLNGKSEDVQKVILSCSKFPGWVSGVVEVVERDDLSIISVNCTKGRHRSVAGALLLQKYYYPKSVVKHMEIN